MTSPVLPKILEYTHIRTCTVSSYEYITILTVHTLQIHNIMQSLRLTVRYILHVRTFHVCVSLQVSMVHTYLNIYHSEHSSHGTQNLHNVHDT